MQFPVGVQHLVLISKLMEVTDLGTLYSADSTKPLTPTYAYNMVLTAAITLAMAIT